MKILSRLSLVLFIIAFGVGVFTFISARGAAAAEENIVLPSVGGQGESVDKTPRDIGDGNFTDYYHFGNISIELEAVKSVFQAGEEAKFSGVIINNNEYPVFDGQVYVQILQQNEKDAISAGDHLRDQFFVEKIIVLNTGERQPFEFSWKAPQNLPSAQYKAVFSFVVSKKYNMAGLSFVNNIYAGIAPFEVRNQPTAQSEVLIDRNNVIFNGQKQTQRAFIPVVRGDESARYAVPIKNASKEKRDIFISRKLYYWDGLAEQNKISEKKEVVVLNPGETYVFNYQQEEIAEPVYFLVLEARDGDAKSIVNLRFGTDKNSRARINYAGLTKFPLKSGDSFVFFANFHSVSEIAAPQNNVVVALKDKKGKILDTLNYQGDIPGSIQLKKKELKADRDYDYLVIDAVIKNKDGKIIDSANIILDAARLTGYQAPSSVGRLISDLRNQSLAVKVLIGSLIIILIGLITVFIYKKRGRLIGRGSKPNIFGIFILLLLISAALFNYIFFKKTAAALNVKEVKAATANEVNTINATVSWQAWWGTHGYARDPEGNGNCDMHQIQNSFSMSVNYLTYLYTNLSDGHSRYYRADATNFITIGEGLQGSLDLYKNNAEWIVTGTYVDTPPAYFVDSFPAYNGSTGLIQDSVYNYTICRDDSGQYGGYASKILLPVYIKRPNAKLTGSGSITCEPDNTCKANSLGVGKITIDTDAADFKQYYLNTIYNSSGVFVKSYYYPGNPSGIIYNGQIPAQKKVFNFNVVQKIPVVDIKASDSNGPVDISYDGAATLTWTSGDATSCAASDDWSGAKALASYANNDPNAAMLSQAGGGSFTNLVKLLNNDTSDIGWYWWESVNARNINGWVMADLGSGSGKMAYRRARINSNWGSFDGSGIFPVVAVQYSDNSSVWNDVGGDSLIVRSVDYTWGEITWPDVGAHKYWRFNITSSGSVKGNFGISEIEFYTLSGAETVNNIKSSKTFTLTCSNSAGSASDSVTVNVLNRAPTANAGPDAQVNEGKTLTLNGSRSSDPDGDALSYLWSCDGGALSSPYTVASDFNAPLVTADTKYNCALTVSDGRGGTASDSMAVTVKNVLDEYALIISKTGAGKGGVTSSPAGIYCDASMLNLKPEYDINSDGVYDAKDAKKIMDISMGIGACPAGKICDTDVSGKITAGDALLLLKTINNCSQVYTAGTQITLFGAASSGSGFAGWSGDAPACSGTDSCAVTMNQARTIIANFDRVNQPPTAALDIQDASGASINSTNLNTTVYLYAGGSSDPDGSTTISAVKFCSDDTSADSTCDNAWTEEYVWTTSDAVDGWDAVTKKKTWSFSTSGNKGVYVQVLDDKGAWSTVAKDTINVLPTYILTVSKAGTGTGTVTSGDTLINCGADCSETYNSGTAVTLTAAADANSTFTGWSGACSGTGVCNVTMDAAKSVTATFAPKDTAPTVGNINSIAPTDSEWCGAFGAPAYNFSWQYNDAEGDPETSFQFQVAGDANFGNPVVIRTVQGLNNPSGTINEQQVIVAASAENDKITYDKTYYWRVKVFNANKDSGWVNGGQFTTAKHQYPTVSFTWDPKYPSAKQKVNFTDKTVFFDGGGNRSWSWVFFDASPGVANTQNPNTKFNSNGVKSVALTATDADGFSCTYPPSPGVLVMDPLPGWVETKP